MVSEMGFLNSCNVFSKFNMQTRRRRLRNIYLSICDEHFRKIPSDELFFRKDGDSRFAVLLAMNVSTGQV